MVGEARRFGLDVRAAGPVWTHIELSVLCIPLHIPLLPPEIYESVRALRMKEITVTVRWLPVGQDDSLWKNAKEEARKATHQGDVPQTTTATARPTTLRIALAQRSSGITSQTKLKRIPNELT